jgi:short-subunit dehydrogenase
MTSRQVMVNLLGAVHTVAPLVPRMGARGRGRIAFIASVAAYRGIPDALGYSASKAGLRAYGEALRARIEPLGIGVTVVCPGFFESEMSDRWTCPQPLRVSGERAAGKVKRGIDRGRRRVTFPLPFAIVMRCLDLLPAGIGDSILRRWRGQVCGE